MNQEITSQQNTRQNNNNILPILISIILTAIIIGIGTFFWQKYSIDKKAEILNSQIQSISSQLQKTLATNKNLSEQITELEQKLDSETSLNINDNPKNEELGIISSSSDIETSNTKPNQSVKSVLNTKPEYDNIRVCGFNTETDIQLPSDKILAKLDVQQYIDNGYRIEDICSEEKNIGYILTKKDSELLKNDPYCEEYCDKNIFGILDFQNNKTISKDPNIMLGINDSFMSGSCKIDGFNFKNNDFNNAIMNFYCLHAVNYFSEWKQYDFSTNSIADVQVIDSASPELYDFNNDVYNIMSESLLSEFKNKSRKDIYNNK